MAEEYYSQLADVTLPSNKYVLVVPGWYPTWQDPFTGDFNQRQVKAAGIQMPQVVLYIGKDQTHSLNKVETRYKQVTKNIVEIIVIYPRKKNKVDRLYSNLMYLRLLDVYAKIIKARWGKPLLIHSYIVIRGGLAGLLLGRRWNIPFILSEHWTIYYREDPGYLSKRNLIFKWTVKMVFKKVCRFLPVTRSLGQQVYKLVRKVPSTVIPNVVETDLFFYTPDTAKSSSFRFVHISTMVPQKNPEGLLRGFKRFHELHPECQLWMIGPYPENVKKYAREIGLLETAVNFTGPVSYGQVAEILQLSHALVLFSRYENLPCVILEALCCGLPVVTTNVGGIPEVIDATNGILLNGIDENELTAALTQLFTTYKNYNRRMISDSATTRFSCNRVGNLINSVYRETLK